MAGYDELIGLLKHLLLNRFAPKPVYIKGLLGDGLGNVEVPGKSEHNYARFNRSATEFFEVFNVAVPAVNDWPVLIGELPWQPNLTQVIGTDWEAYEQSGWGDRIGSTALHAPTHEWPDRNPGADPVNIHMRALVSLRAYSLGSGTTAIYVNAYEYENNATGVVWGGMPGLDLSPVMTATPTGTMRHIGVYLDPDTNTLGLVTGTTTVHSAALEPPFVDFPANSIPSARVRIYGGQASIKESEIEDARRPFAPANRAIIGELKIWTTDAAPTGWLFCSGQAVSRTTYVALFGAIGTTFGVGDGSTTFNLPDMRGRLPLGQDDMGGSPANRVTNEADTIGGAAGLENHTLTESELPAHNHAANAYSGEGNAGHPTGTFWAASGDASLYRATADAEMAPTAIGTAGSDASHNNMPPYLTLNYIIYAGV